MIYSFLILPELVLLTFISVPFLLKFAIFILCVLTYFVIYCLGLWFIGLLLSASETVGEILYSFSFSFMGLEITIYDKSSSICLLSC